MSTLTTTSTDLRDIEQGEKITGVVSGWGGGFHTEANGGDPEASVPLSAPELLNLLRNIQKVCNKSTIDFLTRTIAGHVRDTSNPHGTDLTQFQTQILELLYSLYREQGYTGTYDYFYHELFQLFHVASQSDLVEGVDETMLVTVAGIAKYIDEHNRSTSAHQALFERLVPGVPPTADPSFGINAFIGIGMSYLTEVTDTWSYIDQDGTLKFTDTLELPIDYTYGIPTYPVFETRTNKCIFSNDFSRLIWQRSGLFLGADPGKSLDGTNGTTLIETVDTEAREHTLSLENIAVTPNVANTVSVVFYPRAAKYFSIKIHHSALSPTDTAYFNIDLETGIVTTTDKTFIPALIKYKSGMYRLMLTWLNNESTLVNVTMMAYKDSNTFSYIGTGAALCDISDFQIEEGNNASPIMRTVGLPATRHGVGISIPIDGHISLDEGVLLIEYVDPFVIKDGVNRTVYSFRDDDGAVNMACYQANDIGANKVDIYNSDGSLIWSWPIQSNEYRIRRFLQMYSDLAQAVAASGILPQRANLIGLRRKNATVLDIGHDNGTNFLNSYVSCFNAYPTTMSDNNLVFVVGE